MTNLLLFLLGLLLLSAFFSGAEIAVFSLREEALAARLKDHKSSHRRALQQLAELRHRPQKLLVTILLGNNIVNVLASAMATVIALDLAGQMGWGASMQAVVGGVTAVMTFALLLFGEIIPKSLAHRHALRFGLMAAPILRGLQVAFFPIIWPIEKVLRRISAQESSELTEDEIKAAMEISQQRGEIDENERQWAEHSLELGDHTVETIMTPRSQMVAVQDDDLAAVALDKIKEAGFSRLPVLHEEKVIGILTLHNLIEAFREKGKDSTRVANLSLISPIKVPLTMKLDRLLRTFLTESRHMALVLDEHGGVVGLITMEDILEEIFGEIGDEHDPEDSGIPSIRRTGKKSFLAQGTAELEQIEKFILTELESDAPDRFPWDEKMENETISYLLLTFFERFPVANEIFRTRCGSFRFKFRVVSCSEEIIDTVEITLQTVGGRNN